MRKKYHQTRKDRRDESRGMKRYEKSHRRKREELDSGFMDMLAEDHGSPANLPQGVVHKYYRKSDYPDNYYLDDSIRGIDDNIDDSVRKIESHQSDSMY